MLKHAIPILLLAACTEPPGPVFVLDAAGDAGADAPDAPATCQAAHCLELDAAGGDAGLPEGAPCELLASACGPGLGCRVQGQGFTCQPAGSLGQGADCTAAGSAGCAPGLECFAGDHGDLTCRRWCDAGLPDTCGPGLTCWPRSLPAPYPANAGACG